jgi:monofunctional biosynthetic peptidoglycan transglycosylase
MVIRAIENSADKKENSFSHDWESIDISVNLQKPLLQVKTGFLIHNGFDFKAMQKAYKGNERGRKIKGGSTISQQTAKMYFYGRVVVTGKD